MTEKQKKYYRDRYHSDPSKFRAIAKKWSIKNKQRIFENGKKWREENKERSLQLARDWSRKNKDKVKNSRLKSQYGITLDEYESFVARQEGKCAICKRYAQLLVDHCHKTNMVRGLLCDSCNRGIGFLQDDPTVLHAAATYLERKVY